MSLRPPSRRAALGLAVAVLILDLWSKQWAVGALANAVHPMVTRSGDAGAGSVGEAFATRGVAAEDLREAIENGLVATYGPAGTLRADKVLTADDVDTDLLALEGTDLAPPRRVRVGSVDIGHTLGTAVARTLRIDPADAQPLLDRMLASRQRIRDPGEPIPPDAVVALRERSISVTPGFSLVYAENFGAAWGFLSSAPPLARHLLFVTISLIACVALVWVIWTGRMGTGWSLLALGAILGGAAGNLVDRLRYGAVIDFIYNFVVIDGKVHGWPVYNVADIGITLGVIAIALEMLLQPKPGPEVAPVGNRARPG